MWSRREVANLTFPAVSHASSMTRSYAASRVHGLMNAATLGRIICVNATTRNANFSHAEEPLQENHMRGRW